MIYVRQGAIITGLQNRFKEFRRDKKQRKETPIVDPNTPPKCQQPNLSKSPMQNLMKVPDIPEREDEHSFERINNMLKSEFKKQRPKKEVLVECEPPIHKEGQISWQPAHQLLILSSTLFLARKNRQVVITT